MNRYNRPKSNDYYYDEPGRRDITVIEEMKDRDTGLVDPYGNPIYRQKPPFGFDLSQRQTTGASLKTRKSAKRKS